MRKKFWRSKSLSKNYMRKRFQKNKYLSNKYLGNKLMMFAGGLVLSLSMSTIPVHADPLGDPTNFDTKRVKAYADLDPMDIIMMGMGIAISIPAEIPLDFDENKDLVGSAQIYAYGLLDESKKVVATINPSSAVYNKVYYYPTADPENIKQDVKSNNFDTTVISTITNGEFTSAQCWQNREDKMAERTITYTGTLSVKIENLIPRMGAGTYATEVPVVVDFNAAAS